VKKIRHKSTTMYHWERCDENGVWWMDGREYATIKDANSNRPELNGGEVMLVRVDRDVIAYKMKTFKGGKTHGSV